VPSVFVAHGLGGADDRSMSSAYPERRKTRVCEANFHFWRNSNFANQTQFFLKLKKQRHIYL